MEHKHSVYDSDTRFSINPITRVIKNESSRKTALMQYDHNSERFTFELPRYIEGHDMTKCDKVEVHYNNIDTSSKVENRGVYEVNDLQISTDTQDTVICSWLISRNATQLVGSLNFLLRFCCTEGGSVVYAWNTAICTIVSVSSGIDNAGEVVETYPDILTQWKADLFGVSEALQTKVDTFSDHVASGIKVKLSGAVVRADDVSPIEHRLKVKVSGVDDATKVTVTRCGKNLLDVSAAGLVAVNTSGAKRYGIIFDQVGAFTFSCNAIDGIAFKVITDGVYGEYKTLVGKVTYTFELAANQKIIFYQGEEGAAFDRNLLDAQLEAGAEATSYEPYNSVQFTPESDGMVPDMTSLSPYMTILTDTEGVTVECEYTADTKTYIDNILKGSE